MPIDDTLLTADEQDNDIYPDLYRRIGATLLDAVFMLPFFLLFTWLEGYNKYLLIGTALAYLVISAVYHIYLVQRYGGTPGKLLLNMKVIRLDTEPIGAKEAFLRYSVDLFLFVFNTLLIFYAVAKMDNQHYISLTWMERADYQNTLEPHILRVYVYTGMSVAWGLGEIVSLLATSRKRALHDFVGGTVVVVSNYPDDLYDIVTEPEE